jgi:hypothetical protein
MQHNFYTNEQLTKIRIDERMAEAAQYRLVKQAEESSTKEQPTRSIAFRPFVWFRRLALRISDTGA